MKAFTTFAALIVVVCSAAAALAQNDAAMMISNPTVTINPEYRPEMLIRPSVGPVLTKSDYLGIAFESHDERGLKVHGVVPGGAGDTIGLEQGDIIIGVEGYYCDRINQLENALRTSYGSVKVTVINVRNGQWVDANMRLGRNGGGMTGPAVGYNADLGVGIEMLYGGRNKITSIERGSVAEQLGLTVGDILIKHKKTGSKHEVTYKDAETGLTYRAWYEGWRSLP